MGCGPVALGTRRDHRCPSCAADVARCHSWEGEDGMPARMPVAFSAICTPKLIHFQLFPADNRVNGHSFFQGRQWVCKRSGRDLSWSCRYKGCRRMLGVLVLVCSSMIHTCFFEKKKSTFDLFESFRRSGIGFLPNHAGNLSHSMPLAMSCVPRQRIRQGSPCC